MTKELIATPEELDLLFGNEIQRRIFVTILSRLICHTNTKVSKTECITMQMTDGKGVFV